MSIIKDKITISMLRHKGLPITAGFRYIPKSWFPKRAPSLQEIHKRLSKIKTDLAEEISQMREEVKNS